jgi:hypothetical protein
MTDVRYPNEVQQVQALGGRVVRLINRGGAQTARHAMHASETALDGYEGFDLVLDNAEGREEEAAAEFQSFVRSMLAESARGHTLERT